MDEGGRDRKGLNWAELKASRGLGGWVERGRGQSWRWGAGRTFVWRARLNGCRVQICGPMLCWQAARLCSFAGRRLTSHLA